MFEIKNLHVAVQGKEIIKGLDICVKKGEIHAIMGPNASGKSTLSKIIAGYPTYEVTQGSITYENKDLLAMPAYERSRKGIFLAFQYPMEIPGIDNATFLRAAYNAMCISKGKEQMDPMDFEIFLKEKIKEFSLNEDYIHRQLNVDFSGGEKKRNEIIQMIVLNPSLAILDETDSGLDVDSLKIVAQAINQFRSPDNAIVLVTHYQRLLNYIIPDYVHILYDGKIIETGDKQLALSIEDRGYDWLIK